MFGVKRNGTTSLDANTGALLATPGEGGASAPSVSRGWFKSERVRAWQDLAHGDQARPARDVEPRGQAARQAQDVRHEARRGDLERELLAHPPELARAVHRADHVLRGGRQTGVSSVQTSCIPRVRTCVITVSGTMCVMTSSRMCFLSVKNSCREG